ncbi:MAG: HNH endonuclease, partial [Bacteroidales bacterium]|nr:HNH endonuclease [Bacteroidales bacterium]
QEISIRDLVDGYENNDESGVKGYGGKLDIRPPYQREFIYKQEQQQAVIQTVSKGFPLNVMYWATREDGTFEVIEGEQRTLSICEYRDGNYSVVFDGDKNPFGFNNLPGDKQKAILDYKLTVYICTGTASEKLDWFRTINIAGERLTEQELRNAVYAGSFVTEAKKKFSKTGCVAYKIGNKYLSGSCIRQDYLETVISWINNGKVSDYMSAHQHDTNADELWLYFQNVMNWVSAKFTKIRKEMKAVEWGVLYNNHKDDKLDANELEKRIATLMKDSDVQKKSGIYPYVLDGDEKHLGIRAFDDNTKREVYEKQEGICKICGKHFEIEQMEADHITPWSQGGRTIAENCQMLCRECNRRKSNK